MNLDNTERMVYPSDQYPTVSLIPAPDGRILVNLADAESNITLTLPECGHLMTALAEVARTVDALPEATA